MSLMNPGEYDPRACGADCDNCPLQGQVVVPPEIRPHAEVVVIGEAPGESEEKQLRPFVGPSGSEVDRALRAGGLHRGRAHFTTALLCRPPENDLKGFLAVEKKKHKQLGTSMKTPMECCAPRLGQEIANHKHFIALGKTAANALMGGNQSVMGIRGAVIDLEATLRTPERRVMVTLSPGLVLKQQRWAHVFRNDVAKAIRWFRGEVGWIEPDVTYNPPPAVLKAFLSDPSRIYTYDIETDGIECLDANIRCLAIGSPDRVMVVGFRSNARPKEQKGLFLDYYTSPAEEMAVTAVLTEFFEREDIVKAGHNSGYYDRIVLQERMGINVKPNIDTMILHRNVESELPHGLGYVASLYTEAPAWKSDREGNKLALGGESDRDLAQYCARDVAITARVLEPLVAQVAMRQQESVYRMDIKIQEICAVMHTTGMYVDQEARHKKELELLQTRHNLLGQIRSGVGLNSFNPVSVSQLRDLLFTDWGIRTEFIDEKDRYTGSGDLSTGDLILRSLLTQGGIPEGQRNIIKLIRRYRKCLKVLGTYVVKLRPSNMGADLGWDADEDWIDKETRKKYGEIKRGIVNPATGRMYPGYNAHVAVTGRLSSSKPINAQNFPKALRAMVVPQPGNVFVGADMDQLELRIAAARWGVELYLRAFEEGKDPHSMTAFAVFGEKFCEAAGVDPALFSRPGILVGDAYVNGKFEGGGDAKSMRDLSKAVQYASQYMAKVETVHKLIQKMELPAVDPVTREPLGDGTTDLPYAKMQLKKVRRMRDNWLKGAPEFERGWEAEIGNFRDKGFLTEDVTGRRRDFLDGEAPNEIVNFPIQGSAAGLMNKALIDLYEEIPLHKWGPGTGIINQCHDAIVVECPESEAKRVAGLLEECLNQTDPGLPGVTFTATAGIGTNWKQVG